MRSERPTAYRQSGERPTLLPQRSGEACPSFMAHYVLTSEDVAWLRACGIDPEVPSVEDCIK
jgi:hypothetical protein